MYIQKNLNTTNLGVRALGQKSLPVVLRVKKQAQL